ncbi:MAG TPA: hypothetical protein DDX85_08900 [Nitrospiraceae bacterium]|nr:hypothetical protein [Nitrospiraceae bacterium]
MSMDNKNKQNRTKSNMKISRHHWRKRIKKSRSSLQWKKALLLFAFLIPMPLIIQASDIKGRFYVSDYYSNDSSHNDLQIVSSKLRLYKQEDEKPGFYFNLDGEIRKKISEGEDPLKKRLNELWVGYKFPQNLHVIVGRQYIYQLFNTYIDGLNLKYEIKKGAGFGVFGGLAPDLYDNSIDGKFKSFGAYGFLDQDTYQFYIGCEDLMYEGATDRQYCSARLNSALSKKVRLDGFSSVSINQATNKFELENASANVSYAATRDLRFQLFYDYYRAIKYFESSKNIFADYDYIDNYFLDTNSQSRAGGRVDYKLAKKLNVYASAAYQTRKIDNDHAVRYTGGFRTYDLGGFNLSGRYTHIDNFNSENDEFNVELARNFFNKVDVSVYASKEKEKLDIEGGFTAGTLTYGTSVYWQLNKNYFVSMFVERYDGDDYYNTSVFTQAGYRF